MDVSPDSLSAAQWKEEIGNVLKHQNSGKRSQTSSSCLLYNTLCDASGRLCSDTQARKSSDDVTEHRVEWSMCIYIRNGR